MRPERPGKSTHRQAHDATPFLKRPLTSLPLDQVYAATHSIDVAERIAGLERAYPVSVGADTWIGGNVCLVGPCKVGKNCTIAAGAVVRGEFPDNV